MWPLEERGSHKVSSISPAHTKVFFSEIFLIFLEGWDLRLTWYKKYICMYILVAYCYLSNGVDSSLMTYTRRGVESQICWHKTKLDITWAVLTGKDLIPKPESSKYAVNQLFIFSHSFRTVMSVKTKVDGWRHLKLFWLCDSRILRCQSVSAERERQETVIHTLALRVHSAC